MSKMSFVLLFSLGVNRLCRPSIKIIMCYTYNHISQEYIISPEKYRLSMALLDLLSSVDSKRFRNRHDSAHRVRW